MVIYGCDCEGEECVCHFYHYDCACEHCPDCADCFCFDYAELIEEPMEPRTLMEVFEDHPELMGERTHIDPFDDDEVIECDLEKILIFANRANKGAICRQAKRPQ